MIQNTCIASFITLMMIVIVTALWMTARWWGYREVGMKWRGRYPVPGDPGYITRLYWAAEDWWLSLDGIERGTLGLLGLAVILAIVILCAGQ